MRSRFVAKRVLAPTVLVSLLILAVGVVAGSYVQQLQRGNSDLIARDVASVLAAEDLNVCMREFRHQLNLFLRGGDRRHLLQIPPLRVEAESFLAKAERLSQTTRERELIDVVAGGIAGFFAEYDRINAPDFSGDFRAATVMLVEEQLDREVLVPARAYVDFSRQFVERTTAESQILANRIRLWLIVLGVCGAVGGLMAGFGIALAISRSVVQLQVPIRGAAGKLNEVVGPMTFSVGSGLDGLNEILEQLAEHVTTVVERLQQREREVLRGEHLAAVGQLAAGLAHELRNPLMPIKIMVQAASDLGSRGGLHGRDLLVIEQEITRLESSIQDFLDFARPPEPEKTVFDLRTVVRQTVELLTGRASRQQVSLTEDLPDEVVEIEADRGQIRQVLLNLVLNALDALPDGGRIDVRLAVECLEQPNVRAQSMAGSGAAGRFEPRDSVLLSRQLVHPDAATRPQPRPRDQLLHWSLSSDPLADHCDPVSRQVVLRVADDGHGIPASMLPRVFEPFVSSKETGTGLGLSICQRIVEAHAGSIAARNLPRGGAEFICRMPLRTAQAEEMAS